MKSQLYNEELLTRLACEESFTREVEEKQNKFIEEMNATITLEKEMRKSAELALEKCNSTTIELHCNLQILNDEKQRLEMTEDKIKGLP